MNEPREWWVYVYPEDPGHYRLFESANPALTPGHPPSTYEKQRVRLIEWPKDAELPVPSSAAIDAAIKEKQ